MIQYQGQFCSVEVFLPDSHPLDMHHCLIGKFSLDSFMTHSYQYYQPAHPICVNCCLKFIQLNWPIFSLSRYMNKDIFKPFQQLSLLALAVQFMKTSIYILNADVVPHCMYFLLVAISGSSQLSYTNDTITSTYLSRRPIPPMSSCKLTEPLPSVSNRLNRFSANACKIKQLQYNNTSDSLLAESTVRLYNHCIMHIYCWT